MFFNALDIAGSLIATEMGLMMSMQFNPFQNTQSSLPGIMLYHLSIFMLFSLDLHHWFFSAIHRSYEVLPLGGFSMQQESVMELIHWSGSIFSVGLQIAGPMMAVSFTLLLIFSFLGRAVPQMNVFAESFAVRIVVGLIVLGLTLDLSAKHIAHYLHNTPEAVMRAIATAKQP